MTASSSNRRRLIPQWLVAAGVALGTLGAIPLHAASSFPDNPLLTGGEGVLPNILLILDDSGSMDSVAMPLTIYYPNLSDDPTDRSYVNNSIYYNPNKTYLPWRTSSTDLNARFANASISSAASSTVSANTGDGSRDLRGHSDSVFYFPKSGVTNPGTSASNYDRYYVSGAGQVVRDFGLRLINQTNDINAGQWIYRNVTVPAGTATFIVRINGNSNDRGNVDLYVRRAGDPNTNQFDDRSRSDNSNETITISNPASGTWYIGVYNEDSGNGNRRVTNNQLTVDVYGAEPATPTGRSQAGEIQNFANWYQYARTRAKTAKAGASEAFGQLGTKYRVGFDTIWNRGGSGGNVNGSTPNYPIPFNNNDGRFSGTNRDTFYSRLQGAGASDGTPLHGALQRAARYFTTDNPYKDSSGSLLSCRSNFALLTTDGFWNNFSGLNNVVGNADSGTTYGDSVSDTLADYAYRYWKDDLRSDLTDNVKTSPADTANWQHMVTFGISIGLKGNLDPNSPPPRPWPAARNPMDREDADRIDDLWHAALNGRGQFIVANDVDAFAGALKSAFAAIDARSSSGSNIASTSTKTDSTTLTFVAGFTSNTWIGEMVASPFNAALTGVSDTPVWRLSKTFQSGGANSSFSSRKVFVTWLGTSQEFTSQFGGAATFARVGGSDSATAEQNIDYLRGVQTRETAKGGNLRDRAYPIGDIVDSSPAYAADTDTVYVGANDGMMHGIDARNGQVLFSYIPRGIDFAAMSTLSSPSYAHRYFVDGAMEVTKAANGSGSAFTRNVLVGALGRGGKGVFALDVSTPSNMRASDVLWDRTFQPGSIESIVDNDMGYVLGAIRTRQVENGRRFAFVPNGIESGSGQAVLFAYELSATGSLLNTFKLPVGTAGGSGLMGLGMSDLNQDGKIDAVYGGDLRGNVWKWDFSGAGMPTSAIKLFTAVDASGNAQPITGGLALARDPQGTVFVGFGTGRYISTSDVPGNAGYVAQTQSMYGIIDSDALVTRSQLQVRTIPFFGDDGAGRQARGFENYSALPSGKKGWVIDLGVPASAVGERVTTSPTVFNSAMFLSSIIPAAGSDCSGATGSGYINVVNVFTGTSPQTGSYFVGLSPLTGGDGTKGAVGSVNLGGGMPTQVNVTSSLVTAGDGTGTGSDGDGGSSGTGGGRIDPAGGGGQPLRVNWREIVPNN